MMDKRIGGREASVIWHDVECGAYGADLALWEELADDADGAILDLGCGTGRVALQLAKHGHEVMGLDVNPALVAAFNERADGLPAHGEVGDAREFELNAEFGLAIAPMQLVQLLWDPAERIACMASISSHLRPGGRTALAVAEDVLGGTTDEADCVPDVREVDGKVYSSLPVETVVGADEIVIRRRRKTVSPTGVLADEPDEVRLRVLSADALEREAEAVGLKRAGRRGVAATGDHVGSTVVLLEREA